MSPVAKRINNYFFISIQLRKKYSPSLVFTNMSFTDGQIHFAQAAQVLRARVAVGKQHSRPSAYGFGNARIYMPRRALGRDCKEV